MVSAGNMAFGWLASGGGGGSAPGSVALSAITAATATNSIDNVGYTQTWSWSALTSAGPAMAFSGVMSGTGVKNLFTFSLSGSAFTSASALYVNNAATIGGMGGVANGIHVNITSSSSFRTGLLINESATPSVGQSAACYIVVNNTAVNGLFVSANTVTAGGSPAAAYITNTGTSSTPVALKLLTSGTNASGTNVGLRITTQNGLNNYSIQAKGLNSFSATTAFLTPTAILHLDAATSTIPSFKIASATLLASPQAGAIENDGTHLYYTDDGNNRWQLDQQTNTSTNLYNTDDTFTGTRVADLDGNSLTWSNAGLFRISYTNGAAAGTFDFNEGADFTAADASFSTSFTMNPTSFIAFSVVDLGTMDEVNFSIQNTGIFATLALLTTQDFLVGRVDSSGALGKIQLDSSLTLLNGILSVT